MSDMRKLLEAMDSMARAEKNPTGPKFPGYWKGTDPASKARSKMVGGCEESVLKDLHSTAKKKAKEWDLEEAFKNFKEQDDTAPTTPQSDLMKQVTDVAAASGIKDPNLIYPGDKIKLPTGGEYTVVPGDTLSGILTGRAKGSMDSQPTTAATPAKQAAPAAPVQPAVQPAPVATNNPWAGKDPAKADAWSRLSPDQQKWMGGADPTDPAITNRMPKAPVPELGKGLDKVNKMIAGAESQNNHNITFGDRVKDGQITNSKGLITPEEFAGKSLSDMTMAEVAAFQAARNKQSPGSGAVGKYQFMPSTLSSYAAKIGLKPTDKFDADTQQRLQDALLADNKTSLEKSGIQATPANMYMAHYVGPGGATAVHAAAAQDPDTTVADALVKQKLSRNPKLDYDTEYAKLTKHNAELGSIKAKDFESVLANRLEKKYAQTAKKPSVAEATDRFVNDFKTFLEGKEADYGDEFQAMVKRLGQKAKQGPMKTVWDPVKRVYKTVPVKAKEKEVKEYENEQSPNVQTTSPPDPDASASSQFTARGNEIRNKTLEQTLPNAQNPDTQVTSKGNEGGANPDQQATSSAVQRDPEAKDELQDKSMAQSAMNSLKGVLGPQVNTRDAASAATKMSSGQQPTGKESAAFQSLMPLVAKAAEDPAASASLRNALHQAGTSLKLGKK